MKINVTESMFIDEIVGDEYNSMSYEGAKALFEHLEELEFGEDEIEFDRIAIRCEFSEYENLAEVMGEYSDIKSMGDLQDRTSVIEIPDTDRLIIACF